VRRHQVRDEFDHFVERSVDGLLRTAYLIVWDLPAAEDLVQECLYRVARRWPRVRSMAHPRAYARRILVNLALEEAPRRARRQSELLLDAEGFGPAAAPDIWAERTFGRVEIRSELLDALALLAPRQRAVLALRYLEDLPESEVADVLGCSVGTVKSTASRALDRLRTQLPASSAADADPDGSSFFVQHLTTKPGGTDS
jgi:RNA polymerase sigma-70 factor (sigma-E family)